jgi:hypothetical protein
METSNNQIKGTAHENFSTIGRNESFQTDFENASTPSLPPELNHHEFYVKEQEEMQTDGIPFDDEINLNDLDDDFLEEEDLDSDEDGEDNQNDFERDDDEDFFDEKNGDLTGENENSETIAEKNDDDFLTEDPNLNTNDLPYKNRDFDTYK